MNERVKAFIESKENEAKKEKSEYRDKILVSAGLGEILYLDEMNTVQRDSIAPSRIYTMWDEKQMEYRKYIVNAAEVSDEEFATIEGFVNKDNGKTERVYKNLWLWSNRLEKWGFILFISILILGCIFAVIVNQPLDSYGDFNVAGFFISLATWIMYAIIEYAAYHVLSLLVGALASIVENTKKIADKQ